MMPKVRILQSVSGLDFSWIPGEVLELPDDEAAKWVDGERAELVDDPPPTGPTEAELLAAETTAREAAEAAQQAAEARVAELTAQLEATTVQPLTEKAAQRSRSGGRSRKTETRDGTPEGDTAPAESAADATNDPAPGGDTPDSGD